MTLRIVPMEKSEIAEIKKLEVECRLSPWTEADYEQEILKSDSITLVAKVCENEFEKKSKKKCEDEWEIAGFLVARLIMFGKIDLHQSQAFSDNKTTNLCLKNEAEIYNIAVKDRYREKGIGSRLLEKFNELVGQFDVRQIFLEVRESNLTAINFYLKNGFTQTGVRRNFYRLPTENAVTMSRIEV